MLKKMCSVVNRKTVLSITISVNAIFLSSVYAHQATPTLESPAKNMSVHLDEEDLSTLWHGVGSYIGHDFYIQDDACSGAVLPLDDEIFALAAIDSQSGAKIDSGHLFTFGHMIHGGMCQTGVVASDDMKVKVVATFMLGYLGSPGKPYPSTLAIYLKNRDGLKFLPTLQAWAAGLTSEFSKGTNARINPTVYTTKIYDLNCKVPGPKPRIEKCEIKYPHIVR